MFIAAHYSTEPKPRNKPRAQNQIELIKKKSCSYMKFNAIYL